MRSFLSLWILLVGMLFLALPAVGFAGEEESGMSEQRLSLRPLELEHDGRWIGNAVCYGPHRDGQRPGGEEPTADQLREDLALMRPHWTLMRIYGAGGFAETLLTIIREDELPMKVLLGAWIGPDDSVANRRELDEAIRLTHEFPDVVVAVSVSNETQVDWSPHPVAPEVILEAVREVRKAVEVPVTVADDYNFWNKAESRRFAAEIDFVFTHAHPLWNGILLDDALPWLKEQMQELRELHPDRPIVLAETGWATSVADVGEQAELIKGEPGEAEQKRFYDEVRAWAEQERQPVFWFEAFDENWKGGDHPDEVEKHWGVFHADRSPKMAVAED